METSTTRPAYRETGRKKKTVIARLRTNSLADRGSGALSQVKQASSTPLFWPLFPASLALFAPAVTPTYVETHCVASDFPL